MQEFQVGGPGVGAGWYRGEKRGGRPVAGRCRAGGEGYWRIILGGTFSGTGWSGKDKEKGDGEGAKKNPASRLGFYKSSATTYSPTKIVVPSALVGLTTLFGKGRGEHHCYSHRKIFC